MSKMVLALVLVMVLLGACAPRSVVIESDTLMFQGDHDTVYDRVKRELSAGTVCSVLGVERFEIGRMYRLECNRVTGWVHAGDVKNA